MQIGNDAFEFAKKAHEGQKRKYTGEPYIYHPMAVAASAWLHDLGPKTIAAAFLHDVVEDCDVSIAKIERLFGERVCLLVDGMSDMLTPLDGNRAYRKTVYAQRFWDKRFLDKDLHTLKVLDLVDNARSIIKYDPKFAKLFIKEAEELLEFLTMAKPGARATLQSIIRL